MPRKIFFFTFEHLNLWTKLTGYITDFMAALQALHASILKLESEGQLEQAAELILQQCATNPKFINYHGSGYPRILVKANKGDQARQYFGENFKTLFYFLQSGAVNVSPIYGNHLYTFDLLYPGPEFPSPLPFSFRLLSSFFFSLPFSFLLFSLFSFLFSSFLFFSFLFSLPFSFFSPLLSPFFSFLFHLVNNKFSKV